MMFQCECCHAIFTEPRLVCFRQNLDGENGIETVYEENCPWCGEEWFREVEEFPIAVTKLRFGEE